VSENLSLEAGMQAGNADSRGRIHGQARAAQCPRLQPPAPRNDAGILYDLERIHGRVKPTHKLLLSIALGVSAVNGLTLDRQIRRNKTLLINWIEANYDYFRNIIGFLVLADEDGQISGPVDDLGTYVRDHPENMALSAFWRDVNMAPH
jgi:hypothetical protein